MPTAPTGTPTAADAARSPGAVSGRRIGGRAIVALGNEATTLLSFENRATVGQYMLRWISNGLTKLKLPEMTPLPDLAKSWEVSSDAMTYTFTMNKGVKWHDGRAFSLDDVRFTFETLAHPTRVGPLPLDLAAIEGADEFKKRAATEIAGIRILGDDKIEFRLKELSVTFLTTTATTTILPKHVLKDVPVPDMGKHEFARKPIYTGPFMVESLKSGEGVTVKAFADHFAGRPSLDVMIARGLPEPATALAELQSGGIQATRVPADQFALFANDKVTYSTRELAGVGPWYLQFDLTNSMFSDRRVRQAISHAVDRKLLVRALFGGQAEESHSLISPLAAIHNPRAPQYDYDVEKAKRLFDEAGWSLGSGGVRVKDGKRFEFKINHTARTSPWVLAIQPMLRAVGLAMTTNQMEFGALVDANKVGAYEAIFQGWGNYSFDPRAELSTHFRSPRTPNENGYRNDRVNALFAQAASVTDPAREKQLYGEIQELVAADSPYAYIFRVHDLLAVRKAQMFIPDASILPEVWLSAPQWEAR